MPPDRSSAARDYFPSLTGLRAIAAGWVVLFHLWLLATAPVVRVFGLDLTPLFACGYLGVDLFFVLSGFLLGLPFLAWAQGLRPFPHLGRFWKRRCLRVLPAYFIQLATLIAVGWVLAGSPPIGLGKLLAYLSMEFVFVDGISPLLNGVWWSLPVEWNFYIVLPLLALPFARARWWLVALLVLAAVVAFRVFCYRLLIDGNRQVGFIGYPAILQLPARLDQFVCGMIGAWFHLRRDLSRGANLRMAAAILALGAFCWVLRGRGEVFLLPDTPWIFWHFTVVGALLGVIVHAAADEGRLSRVLFASRPLAFVGTISYSLYLWHNLVFQVALRSGFSQWTPVAGMAMLGLVLLPVVIAVSWLSYRLTERPFLVTAPAARGDRSALAVD